MGDHDAAHLVAGQVVRNPLRQLLPEAVGGVLAVDLGDLLARQGQLREIGNRRQQGFDAELGRHVADDLGGRAGGPGDRATGAQNDEKRPAALHFLDGWMKIQSLDG